MSFNIEDFKKAINYGQRPTQFTVSFCIDEKYDYLRFLCHYVNLDLVNSKITIKIFENDNLQAYEALKEIIHNCNKITIILYKLNGEKSGEITLPLKVKSCKLELDWSKFDQLASWILESEL